MGHVGEHVGEHNTSTEQGSLSESLPPGEAFAGRSFRREKPPSGEAFVGRIFSEKLSGQALPFEVCGLLVVFCSRDGEHRGPGNENASDQFEHVGDRCCSDFRNARSDSSLGKPYGSVVGV